MQEVYPPMAERAPPWGHYHLVAWINPDFSGWPQPFLCIMVHLWNNAYWFHPVKLLGNMNMAIQSVHSVVSGLGLMSYSSPSFNSSHTLGTFALSMNETVTLGSYRESVLDMKSCLAADLRMFPWIFHWSCTQKAWNNGQEGWGVVLRSTHYGAKLKNYGVITMVAKAYIIIVHKIHNGFEYN